MYLPERGDAVEKWLEAQATANESFVSAHIAINGLLEDYRLHADTATPLDEHVCHGPCYCFDDNPPA